MFGFQDQEDGTILESEERSVGTSYVSTAAFGSVTYSPPTMLLSKASSSKSDILNILEHNMDRRTLFYFSKLFLESIKSGDKYQDLKRTITINLLNFNFLPLESFHSTFHLYEDYRRDYMLTDLIELHFIEFPKFRAMQIRACLRTPRTANFAEFSFHARRVWEGVPGVRQANGTKQGAKRR